MPEGFVYEEIPQGQELRARLHMKLVDDRFVCERLELIATEQASLTAVALRRVGLGRMLREAPLRVLRPITFDPRDERGESRDESEAMRVGDRLAWQVHATAPAELPPEAYRGLAPVVERVELSQKRLREIYEEQERRRSAARPRPAWGAAPTKEQIAIAKEALAAGASRRRLIPIDHAGLRRVAETYRTAMRLGQPPTKRVADEHHVSRTTASRWIRRARDLGFLGPARPRVAGEINPEGD